MEDSKRETVKKLFDSFEQFSKLDWSHSPISGMSRSEILTLFSISKLSGDEGALVKVSDIGRCMDVAAPTITQMINNLEKKGLVERINNKEDRRVVQINLTENGLKAIESATKVFYTYFEGLADHLGEEKSRELAKLLFMVFDYFKALENKFKNGGFML